MQNVSPPRSELETALARFSLGPRPDERAAVARDPQGWLRAQVTPDAAFPPALRALPGHAALLAEVAEGPRTPETRKQNARAARAVYAREAEARLQHAATTDTPFAERWVRALSNLLTVSAAKHAVRGLAGAFEREVVRAHAFGTFGDLLRASTQHPAMLLYLDNTRSMGPTSVAVGRRKGRKGPAGLNENLAREILELHTLGLNERAGTASLGRQPGGVLPASVGRQPGGVLPASLGRQPGGVSSYSQADVQALAALLTGWTIAKHPDAASKSDRFRFRRNAHEPLPQTLLGVRYAGGDEADGEAALNALAAHPATARNVSARIVESLAGQPVPEATAVLAESFATTGGDLKRVAEAAIACEALWRAPATLRPPDLQVVAWARALGVGDADADWAPAAVKALAYLGQPVFSAPSPKGFPDGEAAWAGPEQVVRRIDVAQRLARAAVRQDPGAGARAEAALGPEFPDSTRAQIASAGKGAGAGLRLAVALLAPEVQRR